MGTDCPQLPGSSKYTPGRGFLGKGYRLRHHHNTMQGMCKLSLVSGRTWGHLEHLGWGHIFGTEGCQTDLFLSMKNVARISPLAYPVQRCPLLKYQSHLLRLG